MPSLNKVTLIGHLGKDPEARTMANGDAVSSFSIATSESWKDKNTGEKKEATEWHRCVCFRRLAEIANQYLKKGALVYVEGKLKTRKYEKDGQDHWATEIIIDELKMLGGKPSSEKKEKPAAEKPTADDFDDDIPF